MKDYKIKVTETYGYIIDIEANSKTEALEKVETYYKNAEIDGVFVADATTIENTKFKIIKNERRSS